VTSAEFDKVHGYQFTLAHTGLKYTGLESGALELDDSNIGLHNQAITMTWYNDTPVTTSESDILFTMVFESEANIDLRESLELNSDITKAEVYVGPAYDIHNIELDVEAAQDAFTLRQNQPNPFESSTIIGFDIPQQGNATLTIFDLTGKQLFELKANYQKGYHEVSVGTDDLQQTGILYYRLDNGEYTAPKKILVID